MEEPKEKKSVFLRIVQMMEDGRFATQEVDLFLYGLVRGLMVANIGKGLRFENDKAFIEEAKRLSQNEKRKLKIDGPRTTAFRSAYWLYDGVESHKITEGVLLGLGYYFGIEEKVIRREWDQLHSQNDDTIPDEPVLSPDAEPEQEALSMRSEKEVAQLEERADRAEKKTEELDKKLESVLSKLDEILKRRLPYQEI